MSRRQGSAAATDAWTEGDKATMKTIERVHPTAHELDPDRAMQLQAEEAAQLIRTWTDVAEANFRLTRDLTSQVLEGAYEAQSIWLQMVESSFRNCGNTLAWAMKMQDGDGGQ